VGAPPPPPPPPGGGAAAGRGPPPPPPTPVLGFSALQLSPDRDLLAPHAEVPPPGAIDLHDLLDRGLLANAPPWWRESPPRIAARTARERAALGYLHGNCSSCHNADGPLQRLGLHLHWPLGGEAGADLAAGDTLPPAIATTRDVTSRFVRPGLGVRVAPGAAAHSMLVHRLRATDPLAQMPPFGRHLADAFALDLIAGWIDHDLTPAADVAGTRPVRRR
jgi:hypothetical protein